MLSKKVITNNMVKLLESKIIYNLKFEFIYKCQKENVKEKAIKVSFKTIKDPQISPKIHVHHRARMKIGAILFSYSFFIKPCFSTD